MTGLKKRLSAGKYRKRYISCLIAVFILVILSCAVPAYLDRQGTSRGSTLTVRIPAFEEIDNSAFADEMKACADTWLKASQRGELHYGSLSVTEKDYMAERLNPMLYATRENGAFTDTYRDIRKEVLDGIRDSENKLSTVNCITLCNMLLMGIPYEGSRLNNDENLIGMSGYAFDICRYSERLLNGTADFDENRNLTYTDNRGLDITSFTQILTQAAFYDTYGKFGLTRALRSSEASEEEGIWYSDLRPGDVLWTGAHSMFCLGAKADKEGNVTVSGIRAISEMNVTPFSFTVTPSGEIEGNSYPKIFMAARPYLTNGI